MTRHEFSERRAAFDAQMPYRAPYATREDAQQYIDRMMLCVGAFYRRFYPNDVFYPIPTKGGWGVIQGIEA